MMLIPNSFRKKIPFPIKRMEFRVSVAEDPGILLTTRLGPCNVSFKYLYRDASNYKLHGEAVFTNQSFMPIDEIEKQIRTGLRDSEFFIARQVNIEERFFDLLEDDDHPWHEFVSVEATTEPAFDPENWNENKHNRNVTEFIAEMQNANRAGWDEMNIRADVAKLQEKIKRDLKQAIKYKSDVLDSP